MARLQEEVRSAFSRYEEIDSASTIPLKYLKAVAQEAMRIYPPLPFALPRVVPEPGCHVDGQFLPGGVRIPLFSPPPPHVFFVDGIFFPLTEYVCMHISLTDCRFHQHICCKYVFCEFRSALGVYP